MTSSHEIVLRSDWVESGLTDEALWSTARRRGWTRVGRGAWSVDGAREPVGGRARDAASRRGGPEAGLVRPETVAAALRQRRDVTVGPIDSAAAWGLPRPLGGAGPVVLAATKGQPRAAGRTRVIVRPDLDAPVELPLSGVAVSGPLTTVVDCALRLPGYDALAIADAALRTHLVLAVDLLAVAASLRDRRGAAAARRVLSLADGRRESPLESWSGWSFDQVGLPAPQWAGARRGP